MGRLKGNSDLKAILFEIILFKIFSTRGSFTNSPN
jgi:hypothetical protein